MKLHETKITISLAPGYGLSDDLIEDIVTATEELDFVIVLEGFLRDRIHEEVLEAITITTEEA